MHLSNAAYMTIKNTKYNRNGHRSHVDNDRQINKIVFINNKNKGWLLAFVTLWMKFNWGGKWLSKSSLFQWMNTSTVPIYPNFIPDRIEKQIIRSTFFPGPFKRRNFHWKCQLKGSRANIVLFTPLLFVLKLFLKYNLY